MAITVGATLYRKPGMSLEDFKDYLENKHIPFVLSLVGKDAQPSSMARYFIMKKPGGDEGLVFHGDAARADYDCFSVFNFEDQDHSRRFKEGYDKNVEVINQDEARFLDLSKTIVAAYHSTTI